jgi:hypothetical protein
LSECGRDVDDAKLADRRNIPRSHAPREKKFAKYYQKGLLTVVEMKVTKRKTKEMKKIVYGILVFIDLNLFFLASIGHARVAIYSKCL